MIKKFPISILVFAEILENFLNIWDFQSFQNFLTQNLKLYTIDKRYRLFKVLYNNTTTEKLLWNNAKM